MRTLRYGCQVAQEPTPQTTQTPRAPAHRTAGRRGRPRAGERAQRRERVLDVALDELVEHGCEELTMQRIAEQAGASKETLYAWFGSREGLLQALIERNADQSARQIQAALNGATLNGPTRLEVILTSYATGLLTLLTSPPSLALNRAAMTSPVLAELLLKAGRHRIGPLVERYLHAQHVAGKLHAPDPAAAFRLLYGLVVQDTQIRVLLGEHPPTHEEISHHARRAVERFVHLTCHERETG